MRGRPGYAAVSVTCASEGRFPKEEIIYYGNLPWHILKQAGSYEESKT